ncbi:MAG: hypothetical protein NTY38_09590 [Acidobacteria bacterium]|nr:hypothetical protein [Acidobacteriota bacterium]
MIRSIIFGAALLAISAQAGQTIPAPNSSVAAIDAELAQRLLQAKRIYVDSFGESPENKSLAAMVLDAVRTSKKFIVTENRDRADLILKGAALERTTQEFHALGSSTSVAGASARHSSTLSGAASQTGTVGWGSVAGSSSGGMVARSAGIDDSQASSETIESARVAVRLVTSEGDVVWSTTQESRGAKYKSATADVANKVVKELTWELERLEKARGVAK